VINGEKWFSSNARYASFFIVMAITDPDVSAYEGMSMFIVPADAPGVKILRNSRLADEPEATHAYMQYDNVRVPADHILGQPGEAFAVAQTRLGGGRIHHAMRSLGTARKAFEMMCERVLSRSTQGELLSNKQMVQEKVADSWIEIEQFRLLLMRTAWRIDKYKDYRKVRADISAIKALMPKLFHDVAQRALQIHGSLGVSTEMPFTDMIVHSYHMGLADGPTEVHKVTVARQVLRDFEGTDTLFPDYHVPAMEAAARAKFAKELAAAGKAAPETRVTEPA
jgi:acyl-CoA dehydrogenase